MSQIDETIQDVEKMFLLTAAVPLDKDARPVLEGLVTFLESVKIPTEQLMLNYLRFLRSINKNPALRKQLYNQYTAVLLDVRKQAIDLLKGLKVLEMVALQEKEEADNANN